MNIVVVAKALGLRKLNAEECENYAVFTGSTDTIYSRTNDDDTGVTLYYDTNAPKPAWCLIIWDGYPGEGVDVPLLDPLGRPFSMND